jgi:dienelactone hydrolase
MSSTPPRPSDRADETTPARADREREPVGGTRARRRRHLLALGLLALVFAAVVLSFALTIGGPARSRRGHAGASAGESAGSGTGSRAESPPSPSRPSSYPVGLRVLRFVDTGRTIELPNGRSEPRTLYTEVRYPALGAPGRTDLSDAPAARADGPFPLVVFGHGFDVTPALYARLLQSWARAGYVVAAPVFPRENADAPGGPDESDLVNQPADMRFVISRMLAAGAGSGPLAGLIDPKRIAVAGQSDGGDTALALAYDPTLRDRRVGAAVILSGAEIPSAGGFTFPPNGPPLLATQGTADTVNPPSATNVFFDAARRPKYLLTLIGAEHLPPYSDQQPQLEIVERVTTAFLDGYLEHKPEALASLPAAGTVPSVASMTAEP